jgi:hypothetical protein
MAVTRSGRQSRARLETPPLWHSNWSPAKWRLSGAPYYVRPRHARAIAPREASKKRSKLVIMIIKMVIVKIMVIVNR